MAYKTTILITGGTSGLGYHTSLFLARQNPTCLIILASRTDPSEAAKKINTTLHQENAIFLSLDLMTPSSIRTFQSNFLKNKYPPISHLVLNAGIQFPGPLELTPSGIEKTFATNHLGHALLFFLLRPSLTPNARIVFVASGTHDPAQKSGLPDAVYTTAEELAHPTAATKRNPGRQRYSSSKLCNILFTYSLSQRFEKEGLGKTVVALDPGLMPLTGLSRNAGSALKFFASSVLPRMMGLARLLVNPNIHLPQESGESLAWVTMLDGRKEEGRSGLYFEGKKVIESSVDSHDNAKQEDLWSWTVKELAVDEEERKKFEKF